LCNSWSSLEESLKAIPVDDMVDCVEPSEGLIPLGFKQDFYQRKLNSLNAGIEVSDRNHAHVPL